MAFLGDRELNPWYVILRRVVFLPFYILAICVAYVALCGAWGKFEADRFWHNSR